MNGSRFDFGPGFYVLVAVDSSPCLIHFFFHVLRPVASRGTAILQQRGPHRPRSMAPFLT